MQKTARGAAPAVFSGVVNRGGVWARQRRLRQRNRRGGAPGNRLDAGWPESFGDINTLRTESRHDVDHGDAGKIRSKRKKIGTTFAKYAGGGTPGTLEPARFVLVQANLMGGIEADLKALVSSNA